MARSKKRKGFWGQSKEALTVWGALSVAAVAAAILLVYAAVIGARAHKAHTVEQLTREQIIEANSQKTADKLLILAHPDDDAVWAGGHLTEGGWLCVCITNGRNDTRKEEFLKAVDASGNTPLILEYPDKVNGKRDDWEEVSRGLSADLTLLLGYKKWSVIATHNPEGEYGHQHHIITSYLVTECCLELGIADRLMYMGNYYTKEELPKVESGLTRLTDEQLKAKEYMLSFYKSQSSTIEKFRHMLPYEMWEPAAGWRERRDEKAG